MISREQFFKAIETGDADIVLQYDFENHNILREWILEPETGLKRTALYWAVKYNQPDIVELFCDLGHLVTMSTIEYETEEQRLTDDYPYPILLAQDRDYQDIVDILIYHGGEWKNPHERALMGLNWADCL